MRRVAALVAAVGALAAPTSALAQDCPRTTLADVEDEVMCPICGTPLALATEAPQAQQQRAYVERQIADCRSKDEIKQALVAEYGDSVLALPGDGDDDGLADVLVYVIPAVGVLGGLAGITFAVLRWRRRRAPGPVAAPGGPAAEGGRLDADMERYEL